LRVAASGKINADENVNVYLKSWMLPDNEFTQKQPVTLKHLLSHTGGVTVHGFLGYSPDLPVPTLIQVLNGEPPANSGAIRVDKLPGEGPRYSGGGYTIMQQMLIDVEGKPFPQILQEQVLGPLGMTSSTYEQPLPADKLPLAATGYLPDGSMTKGERHTYPEMAAAGLWTTAEDLARYAIDVQLAYQGKSDKVLSREKAKEMLTPFIDEERGLGPGLFSNKGDFYFGHGGWDEGFSSDLVVHRDKGYGVAVLTNSNHPEFISELIRSVALTYNWGSYIDQYSPIPVTQDDVKRVSGRYLGDSDAVAVVYAKDGKLIYDHTAANPMELFKVSDTTFARRERTALIQFMTNPSDGKMHLVYHVNPDDSVRFEHPRMEDGAKVPYEWFLEGDYDRARKEYAAFLKRNPEDRFINQRAINGKGYGLLEENKINEAKALFKINMELFPASADVYDSYAEACMKNGDRDEAIKYYKKTLDINPENPGAKRNLAELMR